MDIENFTHEEFMKEVKEFSDEQIKFVSTLKDFFGLNQDIHKKWIMFSKDKTDYFN